MRPPIYVAAAGLCVVLTSFGLARSWPDHLGLAVIVIGAVSAASVLMKVGIPRGQLTVLRWFWNGVPRYARAIWVLVLLGALATHVWVFTESRLREGLPGELLSVTGVYFATTAAMMAWANVRVGPPASPRAFTKVSVTRQRHSVRDIGDYWAYRWYLIGFRTVLGSFAVAVGFGLLLSCTQWRPLLVPVLLGAGVFVIGWLTMMTCWLPLQLWTRRNAPEMGMDIARRMFVDFFEGRLLKGRRC